jgi:hypothetical protein
MRFMVPPLEAFRLRMLLTMASPTHGDRAIVLRVVILVRLVLQVRFVNGFTDRQILCSNPCSSRPRFGVVLDGRVWFLMVD